MLRLGNLRLPPIPPLEHCLAIPLLANGNRVPSGSKPCESLPSEAPAALPALQKARALKAVIRIFLCLFQCRCCPREHWQPGTGSAGAGMLQL